MLSEGLFGFLAVWIAVLAFAYALAGRFVGLTLFFAGTATLYVLLPYYFFPEDAEFFALLVATVFLGVLGFHVGLTAFSGLSERRLFESFRSGTNLDQVGRTAVVLLVFSLAILFVARPSFIIDVGTYEGRVAFTGNHGPLAFLQNQAIMCAAILIIWAYHRRRITLALGLTVAQIVWAVYSSDKIGLLALCAAWFSLLLFATWQRRRPSWLTLGVIGLLLPSTLLVMVFYSVLRAGITDLAVAFDVFAANLGRLGAGGANVGDFSGPYWVFTQHLRDEFLELSLGATYVEQILVLIPRVLRGDFMDIAETFSQAQHGAAYLPGLGFGFSPWAEGYMNFGVAGFFVQGLLFGLFTRLALHYSGRLLGLNEVALFFQLFMIPLFERHFLAGHVKATIVYCLPFLVTWVVLELLLRRAPSQTWTTVGSTGLGLWHGIAGARRRARTSRREPV